MPETKARVSIEATENVKAVAKEVDRSMKGLAKSIRDSFKKGVGDSDKLMTGLAEKAGQVFGTITNPLTLVTGGVVALGAVTAKVGAQAVTMAADFQSAMANVSTLVDTTQVDMQQMADGVLSLSGKLGQPAKELADGLYQVISAGVPASDALNFLEVSAKAAKAGLTDTFTAVDGLTTVINAFGLETSEAGRVADIMFKTVEQGKTTFPELANSIGRVAPMAASANVSIEELFAAVGTLTKGGMQTSEAVTYLRSALSNIVKPSEQAQEMAKQLGLEFNAQALQANGLAGFLQKVAEATQGDIDKMSILFGSTEALNAVLALTGKQAEEFAKVQREVANATGAADTAFGKQMSTFQAKLGVVREKFNELAIRLGNKLLPILEKGLNLLLKALDVVDRISGWASKFFSRPKQAASSGPYLGREFGHFQNGGVVPGIGPMPAIVHGGEEVVSRPVVEFVRRALAAGYPGPSTRNITIGDINVYVSGGISSEIDLNRVARKVGESVLDQLKLQGAI